MPQTSSAGMLHQHEGPTDRFRYEEGNLRIQKKLTQRGAAPRLPKMGDSIMARSGLLTRVAMALLLSAFAMLTWDTPATAGPVSPYYIESVNTKTLYRVEGSSVAASSTTYCNHCESAIAVAGDVRSIGAFAPNIGGLYGLNTTQSGTTYTFPFSADLRYHFVDGTTNGSRNFSTTPTYNSNFDRVGTTVFSFDRTWADAVALFSLPANYDITGITFGPGNGSLWLQGTYQTLNSTTVSFIDDFVMDATDLGGFDDSAVSSFGHALAMDYADGTLWSIYGPGS
ncbi:MAG: hypothetical protein U1E70_07195 [Acetobacteraceae bacterium]